MFPDPKLLTHENIPKPLHGINPRTIKGDIWWNDQRYEAYKTHNYRCWACGIYKREAHYHKWLEAHETYDINHQAATATFTGVVALCHVCHMFIHCGRMWNLYLYKEIPLSKVSHVMKRGFALLAGAGLEPALSAKIIDLQMKGAQPEKIEKLLRADVNSIQQDWTKWHLVFEGQSYFSNFKNLDEWKEVYG